MGGDKKIAIKIISILVNLIAKHSKMDFVPENHLTFSSDIKRIFNKNNHSTVLVINSVLGFASLTFSIFEIL